MNILLGIVCGGLWTLGGQINKLWRRIGCTAILFGFLMFHSNMQILQAGIILGMIAWGCISYFGWINYIVRIWWKEIEIDREFWWNFLAEGLIIQESILVVSPSIENAVTGMLSATVGAFGKVGIDKIGFKWQAIVSELFFGAVMCAGIIINVK